MKIARALCVLFLLVLASVSVASAGGMVKFHVSPVADPKVGDTVTVTIYNDNNLAPKEGDVVLMLDWNPEVMRYVSSTVDQGHTTASDPIGTHNLEIRSADTVNGLPNGDGALATIKFKIVGPGYTPVVVDVKSVSDTAGTDVTSKAVSVNGAVTATGTAATGTTATATTVVPNPIATTSAVTVTTVPANTTAATAVTTVPTTGITTGITTAFTTIQTAAPVSGGSDGSVNHDSDEYTGVVTRTATPTPTRTATATVTTVPPTTVTTSGTPTPTATITLNTTVTTPPSTASKNTTAIPTTKSALPFGALALAALAGVALVMARARR